MCINEGKLHSTDTTDQLRRKNPSLNTIITPTHRCVELRTILVLGADALSRPRAAAVRHLVAAVADAPRRHSPVAEVGNAAAAELEGNNIFGDEAEEKMFKFW